MEYVIAPTNNDLMHSRGPWKKHKYLSKVGDKYVYGKNTTAGKMYRLGKDYSSKRKDIKSKVHSDYTRKYITKSAGRVIGQMLIGDIASGAVGGKTWGGILAGSAARDVAGRNNNSAFEKYSKQSAIYAKNKYNKRMNKLNMKTKVKASKIINNSAAVKKGKSLISKLAKLFKKKK